MAARLQGERVREVCGKLLVRQHSFQHRFTLARLQGFERGHENFRRGFCCAHARTITSDGAGFKRAFTSQRAASLQLAGLTHHRAPPQVRKPLASPRLTCRLQTGSTLLRLQLREEDHAADAFLAEEHHAEAVDADAARRGHAVFESDEESREATGGN